MYMVLLKVRAWLSGVVKMRSLITEKILKNSNFSIYVAAINFNLFITYIYVWIFLLLNSEQSLFYDQTLSNSDKSRS